MNPFRSFLKSLSYFMTGNLIFPKERIGETYRMEDGREFSIFRHAIVKSESISPSPAIFKVRFLLANMTPERNKVFSLIPIPFFIGLPGFKAKLWMIDEKDGYFQGMYEWNSLLSAQKYSKSFAMKFMTKRSMPGTANYEIIANKDLEGYFGTLERLG